ncbi:histidine phosphatase family containing protein [Ceratobasidium sp. AG-Ba]|nr:histidine phosphatase family containing protein [Ceratobasidium sp. AG-Ba]
MAGLSNNIWIKALLGYFVQSDPDAGPTRIGANPPSFGLKTHGSKGSWTEFMKEIAQLQTEAPVGVKYAVGFETFCIEMKDNVGESTYGRKDWDQYWSLLNTDGNITWGPDAELTEYGKTQAEETANLWGHELARPDPVPIPTKMFSSPLTRAGQTLDITFRAILKSDSVRPYVIEDLREMIGIHTCDKRRPKSYIEKAFPSFDFEPGFTEQASL